MRYAVIMAGGAGTRFWPRSRVAMPKQFLTLVGKQTMLQTTVNRIRSMIPDERILIITNEDYTGIVREQLPLLPAENIVGEPAGRNTAPVVAAAAAIIKSRDSDASMAVLPSDHYIRDEKTFLSVLESAFLKAEAGHNLVTVGIRPYRPETGYGYIQVSDSSAETAGHQVHEVKTFAEKPNLETALRFLESGDFLWNSGMFVWRSDVILKEFSQHLPQMHEQALRLAEGLESSPAEAIRTFYEEVDSVSIDYGIMEKADTVHVIPAEFGWNDVGSWLAVYELEEKDKAGNVTDAPLAEMESCQNCFVHSREEKLIALVGLQGVGVIDTGDALLVCRMDRSQDVKKIVERLGDKRLRKYR
jgi:mannose-1-phosphate guanylyltransferase